MAIAIEQPRTIERPLTQEPSRLPTLPPLVVTQTAEEAMSKIARHLCTAEHWDDIDCMAYIVEQVEAAGYRCDPRREGDYF